MTRPMLFLCLSLSQITLPSGSGWGKIESWANKPFVWEREDTLSGSLEEKRALHPQEGEIPIFLMLLIMWGPRYQHINSSISFVHRKANSGYFMTALYLVILLPSCLSKPSAVPSGRMQEILLMAWIRTLRSVLFYAAGWVKVLWSLNMGCSV